MLFIKHDIVDTLLYNFLNLHITLQHMLFIFKQFINYTMI